MTDNYPFESGSATATTTTEFDVVCGRGGLTNNHSGNRLFRALIKENTELYRRVSKHNKKCLVESIIRAIQHHGGRFLRKNDQEWTEIAYNEAYVKTCQALRDHDGNVSDSSIDSKLSRSTFSKNTQFRKTLRKPKIYRQTSIAHVALTLERRDADQENRVPQRDDHERDDISDVLQHTEKITHNHEDNDELCPLDPNDFIFVSDDEFSSLCSSLLED